MSAVRVLYVSRCPIVIHLVMMLHLQRCEQQQEHACGMKRPPSG